MCTVSGRSRFAGGLDQHRPELDLHRRLEDALDNALEEFEYHPARVGLVSKHVFQVKGSSRMIGGGKALDLVRHAKGHEGQPTGAKLVGSTQLTAVRLKSSEQIRGMGQ